MVKRLRKLLAAAIVMGMLIGVCVPPGSTVSASASFVVRSGDQLMLDGNPYRFVGINWFYSTIDPWEADAYTSDYEVDDVLKSAQDMGVTTIRLMANTAGSPLSLMPTLDNWNESTFRRLDYVIKRAGDFGIRIIFPMVDHHTYGFASRQVFTEWRNVSIDDFYSNATVQNDFKNYVSGIINRQNYYTGVAYKDDPTILAWETGNELLPPDDWTPAIAAYMKSLDSNHLVMDGQWLGYAHESLTDPNVDIVSNHMYGNWDYAPNAAWARSWTIGYKPLILGEFGDWTSNRNTNYRNLLDEVVANGTTGIMAWSFFGHTDEGGFMRHTDHYALIYPGDHSYMADTMNIIRDHAYGIRGVSKPARTVPDAPSVVAAASGTDGLYVRWKGSAGAEYYNVERAASAGGPWTPIAMGVRDTDIKYRGYADKTAALGTNYYYRMTAVNESGASGYSNVWGPVQRVNVQHIADDMNDYSKMYSHTSNLGFDSSTPSNFGGDTGRLGRTSATNENIVYQTNDSEMTEFTVSTYFWPLEAIKPFKFYTSPDGVNYYDFTSYVSPKNLDGNWTQNWTRIDYVADFVPPGTKYLKIEFRNNSANAWTPQIGKVDIKVQGEARQPNLMWLNGDFRQSLGIMWVMGPTFSYSTEHKISDNYSMKLAGNGLWGNAYYDVVVEPNAKYELKFYGKSSATTVYKVMGVDTEGNLTGDLSTNSSNAWTPYSVSFDSGNNRIARVLIGDGGGTHYFDDFEIRYVKSLNNLANPGFESGNSAWNLSPNFSITSSDKKSGNYSLKLAGTGAWSNVYQNVPVTPNTDYTLTFHGKSSAGTIYKVTGIDTGTNITGDKSTTGNNLWTQYTTTFNSGNNNSVQVLIGDGGGTHYFDDFVLK